MRPEIPQTLKNTVIQLYLQGVSRDEIASRTGISQGAVSNIIAVWKTGLGYPIADDLRVLSMILKRSSITAEQSAIGYRLANMIQNFGIDEDNFRTFISEIYQRCLEIGLPPQKFADYVKQLLMLSESIPLWQIPQHIADKTIEKQKLEEDIMRLHEQESEARSSLEKSMKEKEVSATQLNKFCELTARLGKTGFSMDDSESFVKALEGAIEFGCDPRVLAMLVSNFEASSLMQAEIEKSINSQKIKLKQVTDKCDWAERLLAIHKLTISKYLELENMGFGLPMLTMLHDTIHEVAIANKILHELAVQRFLNDMEVNYSPLFGYERMLTARRSELEKVTGELNMLNLALDSKKQVAKLLGQLLSIGFQDKEIVELALALKSKPNIKQEHAVSSTTHMSLNKLAEDSNQRRGLAKDHVDLPGFATGKVNSANVQRRFTDHATWNTFTYAGVEYLPSPHMKDLDDMEEIREMQERALARKSSKSQARGS